MVAPSKLSIARLTPSAMAPEHTEHAVALVHHVLPSLRLSFLRRFIRNKDVHTLVLLLPEELLSKGDGSKEDARSDEEDEGDAEDEGDEEEDAEDDESEDEMATAMMRQRKAAAANERVRGPPKQQKKRRRTR